MKKQVNQAEWHLTDPRTQNVRCAGCRPRGCRIDTPTRFFGRSHLEKYFEDLELDTRGLCDKCQAASSQGGPRFNALCLTNP
jgi:hypothetical protein